MKIVGTYEARTHLYELLRDVANGETITITRYGVAVARMVPVQDAISESESFAEELNRFREEDDRRLGSDK
jgi:prevent-host-death family protein